MLDDLDTDRPGPTASASTGVRFGRDESRRSPAVTGDEQDGLFRHAREARRPAGADDVKPRGVIELSDHCQKSRDRCATARPTRRSTGIARPRTNIVRPAECVREAGLSAVFLQGGQDPKMDGVASEVIPRIRREPGREVPLRPGEKPREASQEWAASGATSCIPTFESPDSGLYHRVVRTTVDERIRCIGRIKGCGMEIGTGDVVGLPGRTFDVPVDGVLPAEALEPDSPSSSPFTPNEGTPPETIADGDVDATPDTTAIHRPLFPRAPVPTVKALETSRGGRPAGSRAGADVITIAFTPPDSREGCAIHSAKGRFIVGADRARRITERAGPAIRPPRGGASRPAARPLPGGAGRAARRTDRRARPRRRRAGRGQRGRGQKIFQKVMRAICPRSVVSPIPDDAGM